MKALKVYLAGKITNNPDYKQDFTEGSVAVLYKLHNTYGRELPIALMMPKDETQGLSKRHYMNVAFSRIDEADVVAFLPNYQDSDGALLEEGYSLYTDKQIMYITDEDMEAVKGGSDR